MTKCFGIISYFPWTQPERLQRQERLDRLVAQLSNLWPDIDIIVIAQQWKFYTLTNKCRNKVYRFDYPALGILKARQTLREKFIELNYDYLIMFDDDAIINCDNITAHKDFIETIDKHPDGFAFVKGGSNTYCPYADSQLNLCAISKAIYKKEPIPNIDAQKSEGFEDRIWSTLLHNKYAELEFDLPSTIRCTHFKNPNEVAPSTWSSTKKFNWQYMRTRTLKIEEYIRIHKDMPSKIENFYTPLYHSNLQKIVDFNTKYKFMQLWGDCSDLGYLGPDRLKGPIDNVFSKQPKNIELLLTDKYFDLITSEKYSTFNRRPSFLNDSTIGYEFSTVSIIHNDPTSNSYITQLKQRCEAFNDFCAKVKTENNYYFTINFNDSLCNPKTNTLRNNGLHEIIEILQQYGILNKCIFIGLKRGTRTDTSNMHINNISDYIKKYNFKYIEIIDNDVWDTTATHLQFIDKVSKLI